jgi:hypothetical protein
LRAVCALRRGDSFVPACIRAATRAARSFVSSMCVHERDVVNAMLCVACGPMPYVNDRIACLTFAYAIADKGHPDEDHVDRLTSFIAENDGDRVVYRDARVADDADDIAAAVAVAERDADADEDEEEDEDEIAERVRLYRIYLRQGIQPVQAHSLSMSRLARSPDDLTVILHATQMFRALRASRVAFDLAHALQACSYHVRMISRRIISFEQFDRLFLDFAFLRPHERACMCLMRAHGAVRFRSRSMFEFCTRIIAALCPGVALRAQTAASIDVWQDRSFPFWLSCASQVARYAMRHFDDACEHSEETGDESSTAASDSSGTSVPSASSFSEGSPSS